MIVELYGLGIEDPAQDDFESAQDVCNRWEDHPEDIEFQLIVIDIKDLEK